MNSIALIKNVGVCIKTKLNVMNNAEMSKNFRVSTNTYLSKNGAEK